MAILETELLTTHTDRVYDITKKVGIIRACVKGIDLSRHWFRIKHNLSHSDEEEIQNFKTELFSLIDSFDMVKKLSDQSFSPLGNGNASYFSQSEHFTYWILLNPLQEDYNVYIHVFKK